MRPQWRVDGLTARAKARWTATSAASTTAIHRFSDGSDGHAYPDDRAGTGRVQVSEAGGATVNEETFEADDRERFALEHVKAAITDDTDRSRKDVEQAVDEALHQYDGAAVRDFVPILVERDVRETLQDEE